jgi:hypothetical protein
MKNLIVLIFALCSVALSAQKDFAGGLMIGAVTSQVSGDGMAGFNKFGYSAGAWVNIPISKKTGLDLGMQYITKGSSSGRDTLTFQKRGFRLNYIEVPLLVTIKDLIPKLDIEITAGPYAGLIILQKEVYNGVARDVTPVPFSKIDFGAVFGVRYWPGEKLFLEIRTTNSVIHSRPAPSNLNTGPLYLSGNFNNVLQFIIGKKF